MKTHTKLAASQNLAVGYLRCSTEMQEDSPEQQKKEILAFAEKNNFTMVEWFVDFGKSGTTYEQRPEFQRLKKKVDNSPKFEAVICYDESRWGRSIDAEENTFWRVYFRKRGVDVLLVKTSVDPKNEFAPMLKAFEGVQASQYSKKLSELTLRGAKNNGIYSNGGSAPFGFKRIAQNLKSGTERDLEDGEWSVSGQEKVRWALGNKQEIEIVQLIFEERITGQSLIQIAQTLNTKNIPSPRRGSKKSKDLKWGGNSIKAIIENPAHYGARCYNKNSFSKIQAQAKGKKTRIDINKPHWMNDKDEWIIVENAHEPIVDKETWLKANSLNRQYSPKKRNRYSYTSRYLLAGLIRCGDCGYAFQGYSSSARGYTYYKYIDGGWQSKRVCRPMGIPQEGIEKFIIKGLKEFALDKTIIDKTQENLQMLLDVQPGRNTEDVKAIQDSLQENKQRTSRITDAIEKGGELDVLLGRLKDLAKEHADLEKKLVVLQGEVNRQFDITKMSQQIAQFFLNLKSLFERATIEEKKDLLKRCISEIIIDRSSNVARIFIRKIPAITFEIEEIFKKNKQSSAVVSRTSSGGGIRTLDLRIMIPTL